jgi:hypothetical protein
VWEPLRFSLFAWSPPLVRPLISLSPLGFPVQLRFRRPTLRPSSGVPPTRPAFTPRGSPVSRLLPRQYALMTRQPCCGSRTPHPTRFRARIGGPGADGITRGHLASHRDHVGPMYRPELCARPGVSARRPPPLCPSLQSPLGGWELTLQPGFPDSPRALVGLSAGPVGTGLGFPPDRRRDPRFRSRQPNGQRARWLEMR